MKKTIICLALGTVAGILISDMPQVKKMLKCNKKGLKKGSD